MKTKNITIITAALFITTFTACKEPKEECVAGTGGSVTIVAYPKHHSADTRPYTVHVKFNTQNSPGTDPANYDLSIDADTTENHIEIENLKCGDYYIYMTAYDTAISNGVSGGIPTTIAEGATGEINLNVPVTE